MLCAAFLLASRSAHCTCGPLTLCSTGETGCYSTYGFEYAPGNDGYVTWVSDDRLAWTVRGAAMGANAVSMVSERPVPQEPMYLLLNLGLSENFGPVE